MVSVGKWVQKVTGALEESNLFYGHGTDNPRDEAAWLVLHAANAPLDGSFNDWNRPLSAAEGTLVLANLAERIERGMPLAYILGSAWFAGLEFEVDKSVLVPRSPIAELIFEHFQPWAGAPAINKVLDLCTGSGCIGIAIAWHMPWVTVDASDISPAALAVARRNVRKHRLEPRVQVYQSDLFTALRGKTYDLVVTNPPYVARETMLELPREYHAEPELGLVSGTDGLDACLQILAQAPHHLTDGGMLVCEVGESEQRLVGALPGVPFVWPEFSNGGAGVFILSRQDLLQAAPLIMNVIKEREHVT